MVTPTWSWLLTRWSLEPSIVIGVLILTAWYLHACGYVNLSLRERRENSPNPPGIKGSKSQLALFLLSQSTLIVALLSPLDYVGDEYLFSAHMVQHLLLATVWPPLLLLSLPDDVVRPRVERRGVRPTIRWLTFPAAAFLIFNIDITAWHIPAWYDATLQNSWIHIFEHLTFMAAGVLAWLPVVSPIKPHRLSYPAQLLYLFAMLFPTMGLGIFFSFYQHALYHPYVAAPRLWGMSAVTDQQLGGLIMWMPGNIPYALAMAVILIRWFDHGDPTEEWRTVPPGSHRVRL